MEKKIIQRRNQKLVKQERIAKIVNDWKTLTTETKHSILDVWEGSE